MKKYFFEINCIKTLEKASKGYLKILERLDNW